MRVLLSTYGSRGSVEPMVGLALALRSLGAEERVCAPPDEEFVELPAGAGVPSVAEKPGVRCVHADFGSGPTPATESLSVALKTALETRARAAAVAGPVRTDGATVAAKQLLDRS